MVSPLLVGYHGDTKTSNVLTLLLPVHLVKFLERRKHNLLLVGRMFSALENYLENF